MNSSSTAERSFPLDGRAREPESMTAWLSQFSDWISSSFVQRSARKYSRAIGTPDHFIEMLLLMEDKRFPVHCGIDPLAMMRAVAFNLRRGSRQGASTIAQQVVTIRMAHSKHISRSFAYKLIQITRALGESALRNKVSLLTEYIETVYWGRSYFGLDRATEGYFGGNRTSLSVAQSFFLAERIAAPNRVSTRRIANLLRRVAIKMNIERNGATIEEVAKVYQQVYGNGGSVWQLLEK